MCPSDSPSNSCKTDGADGFRTTFLRGQDAALSRDPARQRTESAAEDFLDNNESVLPTRGVDPWPLLIDDKDDKAERETVCRTSRRHNARRTGRLDRNRPCNFELG